MRKLYILPFDHRGSFIKMFGLSEKNLTEKDVAQLVDYKHIVYEGFLVALELGVSREAAAILVDEQFGEKIHQEARSARITRILTTEKSGQDEFDFEYGEAWKDHINKLKPEYVKVLVRYNPDSDKKLNERQIGRLKMMNNFCRDAGYKFLFELLAIPTAEQIKTSGGTEEYERKLRGEVMRQSIRELRVNDIDPDVWKLEGLDDQEQFRAVVEETQRNAEKDVGVIVLGRGESEEKVRNWLAVAAKIQGVIGLAVGRTVFKQSLLDYASGKIKRNDAATMIAKNYKGFIDIFEAARSVP